MLFATGMGQTSPPSSDGVVATQSPVAGQPVTVTIGGMNATLVYATAVVGPVSGLLEITVAVTFQSAVSRRPPASGVAIS